MCRFFQIVICSGLLLASGVGGDGATVSSARFHYLGADVLPPFEMNGQAVKIHCQGLVVSDDHYLITGRCEAKPKRTVLLRLDRRDASARFECVDLAPREVNGKRLDHPGGFDRDQQGMYWIPLSTSRPAGPSLICRYNLDPKRPLAALKAETCFQVDDHIGAVCRAGDDRLLGANWDTKQVYLWSQDGKLIKRMGFRQMFAKNAISRFAIQDWKFAHFSDREWIIAGGIDKSRQKGKASLQLIDLAQGVIHTSHYFADRSDVSRPVTNEGLAWHQNTLYLLPEDIGRGAKVLRYRLEW